MRLGPPSDQAHTSALETDAANKITFFIIFFFSSFLPPYIPPSLVSFLPHCEAYGILVPQLWVEPWPSVVIARSPNPWTTKEFPNVFLPKTDVTKIN